MKRYEKMSKEDIMKQYDCYINGCSNCIVNKIHGINHECNDCIIEINNTLNEEIEVIPRAWTFNTAEEAQEALQNYKRENCTKTPCSTCKYEDKINGCGLKGCGLNWFYEKVEK